MKIYKIIALVMLLCLSGYANTFKVAFAQLQSTDVGNFDKMQSLAVQAKSQGAQLVVFPESSVFGWLNPAVFLEHLVISLLRLLQVRVFGWQRV